MSRKHFSFKPGLIKTQFRSVYLGKQEFNMSIRREFWPFLSDYELSPKFIRVSSRQRKALRIVLCNRVIICWSSLVAQHGVQRFVVTCY